MAKAVARRRQHVLRRKPRMPARPRPPEASRGNLLHVYKAEFLEASLTSGLSPYTAGIRKRALEAFIGWADERGLGRPQDVTRPILQRYQRHLFHYRKSDGAPLAFSTQATLLNPVRAFFKWLAVENHLLYNPAADLEVPRVPRQLPRVLLSVQDAEHVLAQPDVDTPMGLRNRAMLETLYSTGIRRLELSRLRLYDVDTERGTLMVRQGKGHKDRLVPIGERACRWIDRYLAEVRPVLIREPDHGMLFVTDYGEAFEKNRLGDMVKRYMRLAGFEHGACHAFRHAMATHMLEGGCDIRYIQAILGHSQLSTTEIYTQVSIGKLKAIHAATHPARLARETNTAAAASDRSGTGLANEAASPVPSLQR